MKVINEQITVLTKKKVLKLHRFLELGEKSIKINISKGLKYPTAHREETLSYVGSRQLYMIKSDREERKNEVKKARSQYTLTY